MPPTSTLEKWDGVRVALKFRPCLPTEDAGFGTTVEEDAGGQGGAHQKADSFH